MFLSIDPHDHASKSLKVSPSNKKLEPSHESRKSFIFNETLLDKGLNHWSEYKILGKKVQRRSYHTSVFYENRLYTYGGYEVNQGILQDFITVDLNEKLPFFNWEEVQIKSHIKPGQLCRHSAIVYKNKMYIYGGQVGVLRNTSQFIAFDFSSKEWNYVFPVNSKHLVPLDSHAAVLWEKDSENASMIVVGGFIGGRVGDYSNAVFEYKFKENEWAILFQNKYVEPGSPESSTIPPGRMSLGAAILKGDLYMFGGNEGNTKFNDLWKFDLTNKKWSLIKVEGATCPEPRSGHTMVGYKHMLLVFGGILDVTHEKNDIFVFNTNKNTWSIAEQATKWVFSPEEKNKSSTFKKSTASKTELSAKLSAWPTNPVKPSPLGNKLKISFQDSTYSSQQSERSNDVSMTDRGLDSPRKPKYEKIKLPSLFKDGYPSSKQSKDGDSGKFQKYFKSTIEENQIKNKMLKKIALLHEFEVTEEEAKTLRVTTPATDALIRSIQSLSNTPIATERIDYSMIPSGEVTMFKMGKRDEKIKVGSKPVGRDGHTATVVGDKMFVFAGDRHMMSFIDLFALDLSYFTNL